MGSINVQMKCSRFDQKKLNLLARKCCLWDHEYLKNWHNLLPTVFLALTALIVVACGTQSATAGPAAVTPAATTPVPSSLSAGHVTEFPLPVASSGPYSITAGPDGNLWFTEQSSGNIGSITPDGKITEFSLPTPGTYPGKITAGPDGNIWFTEGIGQIGRITPTGNVTEFPLPTPGMYAVGITAGPDGNIWFTECILNTYSNACIHSSIDRITPSGQITEFPLKDASGPVAIAPGPDGNLWFTESSCSISAATRPACIDNKIGRITPAGKITEFPPPRMYSALDAIVTGPDGNLWFTERGGYIWRITLIGKASDFPLSSPGPRNITAGADGNLWFNRGPGKLGRITPTGKITEFPLPTLNSSVNGIAAGPDGSVWFTECINPSMMGCGGSAIGRITTGKEAGQH